MDKKTNSQPPVAEPAADGPRAILALAIPALGSLVIEPLLILIDSMMVGHLGVVPLAGLSLASTVLNTLVGIFVFLAYSTTATTARHFGAGRRTEGLQAGIQALWLAAGLGLLLVLLLELTAPWLVTALGADAATAPAAVRYLRAAAPGMVGMLVLLAGNGVLRGLLDTRTPLYVLAAGAVINVALNFLFIYGLNWGLVGAGIGLSIAQTLMAAAMVLVVIRKSRGVPWRPTRGGVFSSFGQGLPLLIRTVSLRVALLITVVVATRAGTVALAAQQVVNSLWTMASFALDALAIAAQSLVAVALGAGRPVRALVLRLSKWGVLAALAFGVVFAAASSLLPHLFGTDPAMHHAATGALIAAGVLMPIGGLVFILDGVLIGAGENRYLAVAGVATLVLYLPALGALLWWVQSNGPLNDQSQATALLWLWIAFAGWFMLVRAVANGVKAHSLLEIDTQNR